MGVDKQGKDRGGCKEEGCDCAEYERTDKSAKCGACRHVPAKHVLKGITRPPAGFTTCFRCQKFYSEEKHGMCYHCHQRPPCTTPSCNEPSFKDPDFGIFAYCSPECRDRDLVDSGKAKESIKRTMNTLRDEYENRLGKK